MIPMTKPVVTFVVWSIASVVLPSHGGDTKTFHHSLLVVKSKLRGSICIQVNSITTEILDIGIVNVRHITSVEFICQ